MHKKSILYHSIHAILRISRTYRHGVNATTVSYSFRGKIIRHCLCSACTDRNKTHESSMNSIKITCTWTLIIFLHHTRTTIPLRPEKNLAVVFKV